MTARILVMTPALQSWEAKVRDLQEALEFFHDWKKALRHVGINPDKVPVVMIVKK